ncbi:MAG TPA: hypothetical protein EYG03_22710 [Planctomycetes bacterium]|nr:hypothetical protein [Fuerstiella sp.]HIK94767.1 hypothetical protein [Planctomycetota bacterium]
MLSPLRKVALTRTDCRRWAKCSGDDLIVVVEGVDDNRLIGKRMTHRYRGFVSESVQMSGTRCTRRAT